MSREHDCRCPHSAAGHRRRDGRPVAGGTGAGAGGRASVLAANEPLNAEEEARVRDFYERRTTRLNMGPSVLIPRLLATLDATRALLADTPSVEPGKSYSVGNPTNVTEVELSDDLDGAWRDAEAALPKVRRFDKGKRVPDAEVTSRWTLEVRRWDSGYHAFAYDYTEDTDRRAWLGGLEAHGQGPTPEAALRKLARALPTQASDSPEKTT